MHISQRFSDKIEYIIEEAKREFENVIIPNDLDIIEVINNY